jgi:hypothetical protein
VNTAGSKDEQDQTMFVLFTLFVGIFPTMVSSYIDILGIPTGKTIEGIIMVSIYVIGSVLSWWHWGCLRASIGWLLFALTVGVLMFVGVKNNPVTFAAFFAGILSGAGLIISEGLNVGGYRSAS